MGHWCEEFGTCQSRGGKGGKGYRSELHTWSSHRHPQDMQGLLGGGSRAPSLMGAFHGGGGWGYVCSSDLASACSRCPVFSHSPSQSQCCIHGNRGFSTCGFLVYHGQGEPSEDAGFQGKLGFSCLESHKLLTQERRRNPRY